MVQEAFIRWMGPTAARCASPRRSCAARSRASVSISSNRRDDQRETYIGPWLPDPVVEEDESRRRHLAADAGAGTSLSARAGGLSAARCVRAGVRGGRAPPSSATRGLPPARARARSHVREARPRFKVEKQRGLALAEAFFAASRSGDMKALARCWRLMSACMPTAAASARRPLSRSSGSMPS